MDHTRWNLEDGRKTEDAKAKTAETSSLHPDADSEFGTWLKSQRETVRVPLEEIAAITKVHIAQLKMIEENHWESLPAPAFVRGFLLCYARHLGLDEDEVLRRYRKSLGKNDLTKNSNLDATAERVKVVGSPNFKSSPAARDLDKIRPAILTPKRVSLGLLALGAVALIWFLIQVGKKETSREAVVTDRSAEIAPTPTPKADPEKSTTAKPETVTSPVATANKTAVSEKAPSTSPPPPNAAASQEIRLGLRALEQTWVSVRVDDQDPKGQILKSGNRLSFEGRNKIELVLSNAGAIEIEYNGKKKFPPGFRGDVVKLVLPLDAERLRDSAASTRQGVVPSRPAVVTPPPAPPAATPAPEATPELKLE